MLRYKHKGFTYAGGKENFNRNAVKLAYYLLREKQTGFTRKRIRQLINDPKTNVNFQDYHRRTPLLIAIYMGDNEAVRLLLERDDIKLNLGGEPWPRLEHPADIDYPLTLMYKSKTKRNYLMQSRPKTGFRSPSMIVSNLPLIFAIRYKQDRIFKLLLSDKRVDVNAVSCGHDGDTALHLACKLNNVDMVEGLLAVEGINVNALNQSKQSVLSIACKHADFSVVNRLLAHKDIDVTSQINLWRTPFLEAVERGNLEVVKRLLAHVKVLILMGAQKRLMTVLLKHASLSLLKFVVIC